MGIPYPRASIRGFAGDEGFGAIISRGIGSNEGQARGFELSLVEDIDVTGARGGGGSVVSCRFGAAGDSTGKAVGGRAIGKCRDDGED